MVERALETLTTGEKPTNVAIELGMSVEAKPIKEVIKTARELFARRAGEYVEIHLMAAKMAALDGNAKPAQWALERIAEGGERVVDAPSATATHAPSFNIGFSIGGVPLPAPLPDKPDPKALPPLDGTVVHPDMP